MKALLPLAALWLLSACDSAKSEQSAVATRQVGSEVTTATPPTYDSLVSQPATSAPVQPVGASGPHSVGYGGGGSVEYYNANTGTSASYDPDVEYDSDGDAERINFPSGGYIGQHHITDQTHNGDGTITVTTDTGQEFTVDEEDGGGSAGTAENSENEE